MSAAKDCIPLRVSTIRLTSETELDFAQRRSIGAHGLSTKGISKEPPKTYPVTAQFKSMLVEETLLRVP